MTLGFHVAEFEFHLSFTLRQNVKRQIFHLSELSLLPVQVYNIIINNYEVNTYLHEHLNELCTTPWHVLIEFNNSFSNNLIIEIIEQV